VVAGLTCAIRRAEHGVLPGEVAIAWICGTRRPYSGGRRPDQVDGIIVAADLALDDDEVAQIETFPNENP